MTGISPERRRVVVLCSAVAAMSGTVVLLKQHPVALGIWIVAMTSTLVYAMVLFAKLKRNGR